MSVASRLPGHGERRTALIGEAAGRAVARHWLTLGLTLGLPLRLRLRLRQRLSDSYLIDLKAQRLQRLYDIGAIVGEAAMRFGRLNLDIDRQAASGIFQVGRDGAEFHRPQLDAERLEGECVGRRSGGERGGRRRVAGERAALLKRAGEGRCAAGGRNHLCRR